MLSKKYLNRPKGTLIRDIWLQVILITQFPQACDNSICVIKNPQRYSLLKIGQRCHDTGNKCIAGVFEIIKGIDRPFGEGVQSILLRSVLVNWRLGYLLILYSRAFITRSAKALIARRRGLIGNRGGLTASRIGLKVSSRFLEANRRGLTASRRDLTTSRKGLLASRRGLTVSRRALKESRRG